MHLWDIRTGEEIDRFGWDIKGVQALFFSHDNQMLVAKCLDNKIRVWELKTGRQIKEFQDNNWAPGAITLCSDGVTLASGSQEGTISLWNIITGLLKGVIKTHLYGLWCLASSPNSNILASGSWAEHGVRLWDVETGKQVQEFTGPIRGVRSVAISRDDQTLAAGFSDDTISLWNMKTGERMHVVQGYFLGVPAPLAFCPDGRLIVGGSQYKGGKCDNRMPLCKVQTGKQIQELHAEIDRGRWHDGMINSIAFSSDGKTLAVGCHNGDVHLWGTGACQ